MWEFSQVPKDPFGKVKEVEIVTQLQSLATKDELEVEEAALSLIAAKS
jgi:DNA polymerase III gamma/tau subunit